MNIVFIQLSTGCPSPCIETYIKTSLVGERKVQHVDGHGYNKIEIFFSPTVKTYVSDFPSFTISSFLASVGGALGLWLGLGVQQMVDCLYQLLGTLTLKTSFRDLL